LPFKILWVDDQIEELRSHVVYLTDKGYEVDGATNGRDAVEMLRKNPYDAILLDEMMPGMGGLETLSELKLVRDNVPVIMITKSEEEDLMNRAIGRRIDDYLVKPVSPLQIVSVLKRQLEGRRIRSEQINRDFLSHYQSMSGRMIDAASHQDWEALYADMVTWELDLYSYSDHGLLATHDEQWSEANRVFARYIRDQYAGWVSGADNAPLMCPDLFKTWVAPELETGRQVYFIVIDCMRLDQWQNVESLLEPFFQMDRRLYWSILPTATPFARNAIFAGLYPSEIGSRYPDWWRGASNQQHSKNAHEKELMGEQLKRLDSPAADNFRYYKVYDARDTDDLRRHIGSLDDVKLVTAVYNFLDIMAHGRAQSSILKELAPDVAAFRTLMRSWFEHSTLFEVLKHLSRKDVTVFITTDHGSTLCRKATTIKGNRDTSSNVRYKYGDNLGVDEKAVFLMKEPEEYMLPRQSAIENYAITTENHYLVYPTNYHEYERLYRDSFQHGGISLEEMIVPFAVLRPR